MSKLQRQEDEMYEAAYMVEIPRLCRICKHYHGRVYGGIELVCVIHPYGYSGDRCLDRQVRKLPKDFNNSGLN